MYLKPDTNIISLLKGVDSCKGDVILHTKEGDSLNLKSNLCRYVLAINKSINQSISQNQIQCTVDEDKKLLEAFLIE